VGQQEDRRVTASQIVRCKDEGARKCRVSVAANCTVRCVVENGICGVLSA
jgi:hypothetical protein